jgi:hypothetical protein
VAHEAGRPYILHSCGNLSAILEDLIEDVGTDGRHSFEDVIEPVEGPRDARPSGPEDGPSGLFPRRLDAVAADLPGRRA